MASLRKLFPLLCLSAFSSVLAAYDGWIYQGAHPYVYEQQTGSWHYILEGQLEFQLTDKSDLITKTWSSQANLTPSTVSGWQWANLWPWIWSDQDQRWYLLAVTGGTFWSFNYGAGAWELLTADILEVSPNPIAWVETFEDLPNGATSDTGDTAWSATATLGGGGSNGVLDGAYDVAKGNPASWVSEIVSIDGKATITVIHEGDPDMESNDHITISTVVDGGTPVPFVNSLTGYYAQRSDDTIVEGSNVQVIIDTVSTGSTEHHRVYEIRIEGVDPFPTPFPPGMLDAEATSSMGIRLQWVDNSENETGFSILRRMGGGSFAEIATVGEDVTVFHDTGLSIATEYEYAVIAFNDNGNSAQSDPVTIWTWSDVPPEAPSNLTENTVESFTTLTWADNSIDESVFEIHRLSPGESSFTLRATVDADVSTYNDNGLEPNSVYQYKVRAVNGVGSSAFSNTVSITTGDYEVPSDDIVPLWPLINPSFELSSSEGGWVEQDPNGNISNSSSSSPAAYDGSHYLKISDAGGFMEQALYQPIAGHRYEITAWVYNHGTVGVEDLGSDTVFETSTNHGNSWQQIRVSYISTGSPAFVYVSYGPGTGDACFDLFETADISTDEDLAAPLPRKIMRYPSQVIDVSRWKLTLPINNAMEIHTPELYRYSIDPWYKLVQDEDGYAVQFRANHGGASTGGSKNPRSEYREMDQNYHYQNSRSHAAWSNTDGKTHSMWIKQKVTHLTRVKPHVVVGQIHDGGDDVTVFRIEAAYTAEGTPPPTHAQLWITRGNTSHGYLVDGNYELGTVFEVKFIAHNGVVEYEYNGERVDYVHTGNISGCYFKLGNYTQSNNGTAPTESDTAYAETYVYDYEITHE
jgi:hypothetical protein